MDLVSRKADSERRGKPEGSIRRASASRNRVKLQACGLLMLGALWLASYALAAPVQGKQQPAASDFVGSGICATCHEEVAKGLANNPHTGVTPMHGSAVATTCESCHGPGKAHVVSDGDKTKILNPAKIDQNAVCTKCHTDQRGPFVYEHAPLKAEGCSACHTIHGSQNAQLLNTMNVNALCNQCHSPATSIPEHSPSAGSSELASCTACHAFIHGSNRSAAFLRSSG